MALAEEWVLPTALLLPMEETHSYEISYRDNV